MTAITRRGPLPRVTTPLPATLLVIALLVIALLAGCGAAAPTPPARQAHASASGTSPAPGDSVQPAAGPARLGVLSATFTSARAGWALALRPCHAAGCPKLVLRRTVDHGRHWSAVPAPPAPVTGYRGTPATAVGAIWFADARDGWAFGPGLWATHDGGQSWHRIGTHGLAVENLTAQGGWAIATLGRCPPAASICTWFRVYFSPVTADRWRPAPGAVGRGRIGSITVEAGTGYIAAVSPPGAPGTPGMTLLAGPANGSRAWRRLTPPCPPAFTFDAVVAAAVRLRLVAGCASEPGAGAQLKRAYLSPDGGRTWHRLADLPVGGYLSEMSLTPAGTIMATGGRSDIYLSWDTGRTWHTSASLREAVGLAGAGFNFDAAMTTSTQGYAIQEGAMYRRQIWFTYDAGHTWRPVTLH